MENKKSASANLEQRRPQAFLLGLLASLALVFALLEFTSRPDETAAAGLLLDDVAQDLEMMAAQDRRDMVAAAPVEAAEVLAERINEVEEAIEQPQENQAPPRETDAIGVPTAEDLDEPLPTQTAESTVVNQNDEPLPLRVLEEYPQFPGGASELMKWLTKMLQYPPQARQQKIQGLVKVAFIVNPDGTTADAKITQPAHPLLDKEALRVVRMMPRWKPGQEKGKPCRSMVCIPVNFKL